MTLLWFVIWFVSNLIGDKEALTFDPVNWWAGTLILAAAIDLQVVRDQARLVLNPPRSSAS